MTGLFSWLRHQFSPEPAAAQRSSGRKRTHTNAWLGHEVSADGAGSAGGGRDATSTGTVSAAGEEVRARTAGRGRRSR